jgi:hypothetical protein
MEQSKAIVYESQIASSEFLKPRYIYIYIYIYICVRVCNKDVGVAIFETFLGVFANLREVTLSFVVSISRSVCPSVRKEQLCFYF